MRELIPYYMNQKSFYRKAFIVQDGYSAKLYSYDTHVATIDTGNNRLVYINYYSATTSRHQNEFLQQFGFEKMTKKQMEEFK